MPRRKPLEQRQARRPQRSRPAPDTRAQDLEVLIRDGKISFGEVVRLKHWRDAGTSEEKALGEQLYEKALSSFKKAKSSETKELGESLNVSVFACGCGAFVTPDGRFWHSIIERAIGFDWLDVLPLLNAINNLAARSCDLWPADPALFRDVTEPPPGKGLRARVSTHLRNRRLRRAKESVMRREPHRDRVYEICTSLFSAVNMETLHRSEMKAGGQKTTQDPSSQFRRRLQLIAPSIRDAESNFHRSAQRYAQGLYGRGMVLGIFFVGMVCGLLATVFLADHVPAWYGVAILAGGVGAAVSVLQRMASGRLRLEYDAGRRTLLTLGAVRPIIGATFGTVLFCAVEGGWLPAIHASTSSALAFYAVLGFLAGFNERFAQDMLVISANQLRGSSSSADNSSSARWVDDSSDRQRRAALLHERAPNAGSPDS